MAASPIVVVGGGPAGALAAENLARVGREVTLFDEKLAREKPCGGGISEGALDGHSKDRNVARRAGVSISRRYQ
jgi:flavin-dependent dehydrogenase